MVSNAPLAGIDTSKPLSLPMPGIGFIPTDPERVAATKVWLNANARLAAAMGGEDLAPNMVEEVNPNSWCGKVRRGIADGSFDQAVIYLYIRVSFGMMIKLMSVGTLTPSAQNYIDNLACSNKYFGSSSAGLGAFEYPWKAPLSWVVDGDPVENLKNNLMSPLTWNAVEMLIPPGTLENVSASNPPKTSSNQVGWRYMLTPRSNVIEHHPEENLEFTVRSIDSALRPGFMNDSISYSQITDLMRTFYDNPAIHRKAVYLWLAAAVSQVPIGSPISVKLGDVLSGFYQAGPNFGDKWFAGTSRFPSDTVPVTAAEMVKILPPSAFN
jgi:hypothetical protein